MVVSSFSPVQVIAWEDPGDETLRNFRYQICYGVVLLVASITGAGKEYVSVYCEQHDDYLCELANGKYDAVQVKTRKPEIGEWEITDEPIMKSIFRFYEMEINFPHHLEDFFVVSNAQYLDTESADPKKAAKCPVKFCNCLTDTSVDINTKPEFLANYGKLKSYLVGKGVATVDDPTLLSVLRRITWTTGPSRDGFFEYITQSHMTQLNGVGMWPNVKITKLTTDIVLKIFHASSLFSSQPAAWLVMNQGSNQTAAIAHKRIETTHIKEVVRSFEEDDIGKYYPNYDGIRLESLDKALLKLDEKMQEGGIAEKHISRVKDYALAAEATLLNLIQMPGFDELAVQQIEAIVESACEEAQLFAESSSTSATYGSKMLSSIQSKLRDIALHTPQDVFYQRYELLVGVAGLLSQECRIWWSEEFVLKSA
ncbi:dsDNA nuclease domain-containing protein [Hymenobacter lucidus]|uniref:DUF4297 domain-containing protein n=1 Tax=Hymenobacter lucidus TaxID=2880930 RepID=A0ABS8AZC5_9BACT|nr:dsDNA nuclease domain-containing protein [Hymenobacter lucidus]MCB2411119.1 DUF4297 domain-containing protein [Hymenobacter lucidus]